MNQSPRYLVVIAGSAGSLGPLTQIASRLDPDIDAAVVVVMHRSPERPSHLPEILARRANLPVVDARDGEELEAGHIYVVPPGHHQASIEEGVIRLRPAAKVHFHRPAADPLFESAARAFGDRCIGVVLSGMGRNGESGLTAIRTAGGRTIVQDPRDADHPSMPLHALELGTPDFCGPAATIGDELSRWCETDHGTSGRAMGS